MSHEVGPDDLMRLLDDELPPERHAAVQAHVRTCAECRRDYTIFQQMKGDLRSMAFENETGPSLWDAVSRRLFRPSGWLLVGLGSVSLAAWGIVSYITSPERLWTKLATGAVAIGLALLLLSAIFDRLRDLRTDRYKGIQR